MQFRFVPSLDDLPHGSTDWWSAAAVPSFFFSKWWFQTIIESGLDAGDEVAIGCLEEAGRLVALLPCRFTRGSKFFRWRRLESFTGPYSCLFRPLIWDMRRQNEIARILGRELGRSLRASNLIWFDAMDAEWPAFGDFRSGLAQSGFITSQYDNFGNWNEPMAGRSFQEYITSLDGALQEIVRRKGRAAKRHGAEFRIVSAPAEIDQGIDQYHLVYARSWKVAEPYPNFHTSLMRNAAKQGALRLGICNIAGQPVAAQLWIVWEKKATMLKLAHDEAFAKLSIGSVLTAHMTKALLDSEQITEIDFGRGDDLYKSRWTTKRRQRVGLIAANPRSVAGCIRLVRQTIPETLRFLSKRG